MNINSARRTLGLFMYSLQIELNFCKPCLLVLTFHMAFSKAHRTRFVTEKNVHVLYDTSEALLSHVERKS